MEPRRLTEQTLVVVIQEAWIGGVSTRKVDGLVRVSGMSGISKSQVSALCQGIDERVDSFPNRPIEGECPCLWPDATYLEVRQGGRVVSVAAILACGINQDGRSVRQWRFGGPWRPGSRAPLSANPLDPSQKTFGEGLGRQHRQHAVDKGFIHNLSGIPVSSVSTSDLSIRKKALAKSHYPFDAK
jgi:hypothetical protein